MSYDSPDRYSPARYRENMELLHADSVVTFPSLTIHCLLLSFLSTEFSYDGGRSGGDGLVNYELGSMGRGLSSAGNPTARFGGFRQDRTSFLALFLFAETSRTNLLKGSLFLRNKWNEWE